MNTLESELIAGKNVLAASGARCDGHAYSSFNIPARVLLENAMAYIKTPICPILIKSHPILTWEKHGNFVYDDADVTDFDVYMKFF